MELTLSFACADLWGVDSDTSANVVGFKYYGLAPVISLLASKSSREYDSDVCQYVRLYRVQGLAKK